MAIHEVYPYLRAASAEKAIAFYIEAFGAVEDFRLTEPSGKIGHAELKFGNSTIMISDAYPELGFHALEPDGPSVSLIHLHVDNADSMIAAAVVLGARIVREPEDQFQGERSGTIRDPFGYDWMIGHSIEDIGADEMQRRYSEVGRSK